MKFGRLILGFAFVMAASCSGEESAPSDSSNEPTGGKSDEFVSEEASCADSGGTWTDDASDAYYCICSSDKAFVVGTGCTDRAPIRETCEGTGGVYEEDVDYAYCTCPGERFVDHGNCLAPDPAEEDACLEGGGLWTDDASDSYYCACAEGQVYVKAEGCIARTAFQATCEATGGLYEEGDDYATCQCGEARYAEDANCLAPDPAAESACLESGGEWTDDASDSYYCICPGEVEVYDGTPCE